MKSLRAAAILALPALFVSSYVACASKPEHGPPAPIGSPADAFDIEAFHPFGDVGPLEADADARPESTPDSDSSPDSASDSVSVSDSDSASDSASVSDSVSDAPDGETAPRVKLTYPCEPPLTTSTASACGVTVQSWKIEDADDAGSVFHVGFDTDVAYCTQPPNSGPHYPVWAAFRSYTTPVPHENLVHDLEHGAVVVLFRCTAADGCPSVAASLQAVIDARPVDPLCDPTVKRRIVLAPDPTLDVAIGAGAWGWTYRATCVDATTLGAFIDAHYGHGPEDFCSDGCAGPFPTCAP